MARFAEALTTGDMPVASVWSSDERKARVIVKIAGSPARGGISRPTSLFRPYLRSSATCGVVPR